MQGYILSIAGAVLLSALIAVVSPEGKMGKFIKGASKLVLILVMIAPFASALKKGEFSFTSGKITLDSAYLEECSNQMEQNDEAIIRAYLKEEYSIIVYVEVERNAEVGFAMQKIQVNITDFGIIGQDERINIMTQIEKTLEEKYGCETEVG